MHSFYTSEVEIETVVQGFESCKTGKSEFKHRDHLTVAVWYLSATNTERATGSMRAGLLRFLDHHGVGREKYNETLTVFWMDLVSQTLREIEPGSSLVEKCNHVLESLQDPALTFEYYSKELLWSDDARKGWVEPDLKAWKQF